jgi:hypothetical protein
MKPENMLIMPYPEIPSGGVRKTDQIYLKFIDFSGAVKLPENGGQLRRGEFLSNWTPKYKAPEKDKVSKFECGFVE